MLNQDNDRLTAGWVRFFARKTASWLSPAAGSCAYCGSAMRGSAAEANPFELCRSCFQQIPWIRKVHCAVCGRYEACYDCRRRDDSPLQCNRSAVRYDEAMKKWLAAYKYRGDERLLRLLASMLMHAWRKLPEVSDLRQEPFDCITYVPLSGERLLERGFNQAEQLAREMSRRLGLPLVPMLVRVRHTEKMSFQRRSERLRALAGAFAMDSAAVPQLSRLLSTHPTPPAPANPALAVQQPTLGFDNRSRPLRILIVDDVYTTGSTLHQCATVIRQHVSARVCSLTWAR